MIASKIRTLLDQQDIPYTRIEHAPALTAAEVAQRAHIRGREMAKSVIVKVGDRMAMVVVPASRRVSLGELQEVVGTLDVRLAQEHEFANLFPDCEPGAMPPFGNLYGLDVYVDPILAADDEIAFNAGTHTEVIRMKYADYEKIVQPRVAVLT